MMTGRWWRRLAVQVGGRLVLLALCGLLLVPLFWMLSTALKPPAEVTAFPPTVWPESPRWANFRDAVQFIPFGRYFVNSLIVTVFGTVGTVGSSFIIAYGLSRIRWPGRELVFYIVIASIFIYIQFPVNPITMIPLFTLFASLGWTNTFLPLIVPTFFGNPFYIFLLRQFLMQIPSSCPKPPRSTALTSFRCSVLSCCRCRCPPSRSPRC
ncbi:MAG: carbohydrate ABC transporter permease [Trueperaceae bacterium]|nr:carbohydrate ABC transporter permease [Trueperaceae bacterium]